MKTYSPATSRSFSESPRRDRAVRRPGGRGTPFGPLGRRALRLLAAVVVIGFLQPAWGQDGISDAVLADSIASGSVDDVIVSNLIVNGDFATDLSGWTEEEDPDASSFWAPEDVDDSPGSGSLVGVDLASGGGGEAIAWQCVGVEPGARYVMSFAAREERGHTGEALKRANLSLYDVTDLPCPPGSDPPDDLIEFGSVDNPPSSSWSSSTTLVTIPLVTPGTTKVAVRADVCCAAGNDSFNDDYGVYFDDVVFGKLRPDLAVEMVPSTTVLAPGEEFSIELDVASVGDNVAQQPDVRIFHGLRISLVSWVCDVGSVQDQGTFFQWINIPDMPTGVQRSCTITARAEPGPAGTFPVDAVADCPECDLDPSDNQQQVTLDLLARPDVGSEVAVTELPEAGDLVDYELTLTNFGTATAVSSVALTANVPLDFQPSDTGLCANFSQTGINRVEGGVALFAGETIDCTLTFLIPPGQPQDNFLGVVETSTAGDYDASNDNSSALTRVVRLLVNRSVDGGDRALGDGICEVTAETGDCSLRAAVMEANALQTATGRTFTVELPHLPVTYQLTNTLGDDAQLYGSLDILRRMNLIGVPDESGALPTVVAAFPSADADRLIRIGSPAGFVRIENVHLRGQGLVPTDTDGLGTQGGLILHRSGELVLRNVTLADGATDGRGGAIHSASDDVNGHLTLERVEMFDNVANQGGGLAFVPESFAVLTIEESEIHGNGVNGSGGGVFAAGVEPGALPFVAIERSTLYGNTAAAGGGAYFNGVTFAALNNSTMSGNVGQILGGGLGAVGDTPLAVNNSTIAFNHARPGDDDDGLGGGIYLNSGATATLHNSIVSGNTAQQECSPPNPPFPPICVPVAANCFGTLDSAGYNSVGAVTLDSECDITAETGDFLDASPQLANLADNGGPTPTHALTAPGNEVDLGDPACLASPGGDPLTVDQRGALRPADGNDDGTARCDKGAFEVSDSARISVTVVDDQLGRVNSSPSGIACGEGTGNQCSALFAFEAEVTLTATVASGSGGGFAGWQGACAGQGNPCTVVATGDLQVTATFELGSTTRTLEVQTFGASGGGEVVSSPAGIDCPSQGPCEAEFPIGAEVTLNAFADTGSVFLGFFGGGCAETPGAPCTVTLDTDLLIGAWFEEERFASFTPTALEVDPETLLSDGNRVFEPGERVEVAPTWRNSGDTSDDVLGEATAFTGPGAASYQIVAPDADYGLLFPGGESSCRDATGVCYQTDVGPAGAERPAPHWDATFDETLSDEEATSQTWTLHLGGSFTDVSRANLFYRFVETLLHNGVTSGCIGADYCPEASVTRAQMAVFVLRAREGADFSPPACETDNEVFADVAADSPFCPWIEELADRGVVSGCGGGSYCPGNPVTRAQMAIFLLKTLEGSGYTPPSCLGQFADVSCPSLFADWIEELFNRGITGGCGSDPLAYCPGSPVTRAQMGVFLTKAFALELYGP